MMNTQNKEDIPTRNFKKKKNNKNILNWRQTTFHVAQKRKQNKKTTKKKKKPAKHREKFSNVPAELTSRTMQNGRKYQTTWNFFFFSKTLSINTLFHFPTRKIGNFLTFTHPTPILVSSATRFISPTTSLKHQRLLGIPEDPKNSHYSSELYCYFCRPPSRLIIFFPKVTFCF